MDQRLQQTMVKTYKNPATFVITFGYEWLHMESLLCSDLSFGAIDSSANSSIENQVLNIK